MDIVKKEDRGKGGRKEERKKQKSVNRFMFCDDVLKSVIFRTVL